MLTETEINELRELRIVTQNLDHTIQIQESELIDVQMEITALKKWKKGRWIGFFLALLIFTVLLIAGFFYADQQFNSTSINGVNDAFIFSVSTTALMVLVLLLAAMAFLCIWLGLKAVIEVGSSRFARVYARRHYCKNYYNEMEECVSREDQLKRELLENRIKCADAKSKRDDLESRETPWYNM